MGGLSAQYYLRGEIRDEKNQVLANAKIILQSDHMLYYSGSGGGFGLPSVLRQDSITVMFEGYETVKLGIVSGNFLSVVLKPLSSNANKNRPKLISITKDRQYTSKFTWHVSDESYFSLIENETVNAASFPNTGFSLNVNKASYSNIRRFLKTNSVVPPDAVRCEELLNYFNLNYSEPDKGDYFKIESNLSSCPWKGGNHLLYLNVNARKIDMRQIPPSNLVFLIDASGSMDMPNRLPLVKAAFQLLVKNLRPVDTVSIVIYGGTVAVWLDPTSGAEKEKIIRSIEELTAMGDTPGESAIRLAYRMAKRSFIPGGNNRVIIATDGDFNVGEVSEKALEDLVSRERQSGVYLTCLGVGMGNFKDSKLEALAKKGNGNYAYLDDINEAEKVLVKEMTQTFFTVANDVFLNVQFNPSLVKEYRLIGFDNRRDAIADSTGDLEGGEIGSGNSMLAIFELTLQAPSVSAEEAKGSIARVKLRFKPSDLRVEKSISYECPNAFIPFNSLKKDLQFGAAVAMFGLRLRQSKYIPSSVTWAEIEKIAVDAHNPGSYLQNGFISLLASAKKVYTDGKKGKRRKSEE
jgi:Ca-activated chloride channel family protein